jgi:hypothetical protein
MSWRVIQSALRGFGYDYGSAEAQEQRRRDFKTVVKGQNLLTRYLAGVYRLKAKPYVLVEVTYDPSSVFGKALIGLTVVDMALRTHEHDKSRAVHSLYELVQEMANLEGLYS